MRTIFYGWWIVLASFLIAVLCQILVPKANEAGRVPAVEVMIACPAVTNTIREGRLFQLHNAIMTHAKLGMILLDNALSRLQTWINHQRDYVCLL